MKKITELSKEEKITVLAKCIEKLKILLKENSEESFFMCIEICNTYIEMKNISFRNFYSYRKAKHEISFILIPEFEKSKPEKKYSHNSWYKSNDYLSKINHLSLLVTEIRNS